jgi:hypothetical protein
VNLLRLNLRKVLAEARLELQETVYLIRKCLQSRSAVWAETQDFSAVAAPELETQLVEVHRTQKRATQVRERYSRQLALDDERRRETRARNDAELQRVRGGHR